MHSNLPDMIRLITRKGKDDFISSLREELDGRLNGKVSELYANICENLYQNEIEKIDESELNESSTPKFTALIEKPIHELISSLQESIRDEKTIVHRFFNGESVTITHDDSRCLVNLHDSLNRMNQEKMRKLMSENYSEYNKILQFSRKYTERTQK
jgi:hypothetical protein